MQIPLETTDGKLINKKYNKKNEYYFIQKT